MEKQRCIVIPLYDHTTKEEIADSLRYLLDSGFDDYYVQEKDGECWTMSIEELRKGVY